MIHVNRTSSPEILSKNAVTWTHELLSETDPRKRTPIEKRYNKPQVRKALQDMFHNKCAFCERILRGGDRIEHFRPRKLFPELTFDWSNLLLACEACNLKKSDSFPLTTIGETTLNPTIDDPSQYLRFEIDQNTGWVNVYGTDERGKLTIELVDLNHVTLRRLRFNFIIRLMYLTKFASDNLQVKTELKDAFKDESEFAGSVLSLIHI